LQAKSRKIAVFAAGIIGRAPLFTMPEFTIARCYEIPPPRVIPEAACGYPGSLQTPDGTLPRSSRSLASRNMPLSVRRRYEIAFCHYGDNLAVDRTNALDRVGESMAGKRRETQAAKAADAAQAAASVKWRLIPPLALNQFMVAEAKLPNGQAVPAALVLWARVSAEIAAVGRAALPDPVASE
jgi:hypothetical protein